MKIPPAVTNGRENVILKYARDILTTCVWNIYLMMFIFHFVCLCVFFIQVFQLIPSYKTIWIDVRLNIIFFSPFHARIDGNIILGQDVIYDKGGESLFWIKLFRTFTIVILWEFFVRSISFAINFALRFFITFTHVLQWQTNKQPEKEKTQSHWTTKKQSENQYTYI